VAIVRRLVLFLRKLDCNCDANEERSSLRRARVGELEAGVMQKSLAILAEGHNKRQGVGKS
jgi:hypothetical protein